MEAGYRRSAVCAVAIAGICLVDATAARALRSSAPFAILQIPSASQAIVTGDVRLVGPDGSVVASVDVWASDRRTGIEVSRDQTDRDGRFTLSLPPGGYTISAARPTFLQSSYGSPTYGLPGSPLVVTAGERREIPLIIHRAAAVTGLVRDEKGDPVQNASVEFLRQSIPKGVLAGRTVARATTDADGAYHAYGLPPGDYLAVAMVTTTPSGVSDSAVRVNTLAAQFFPGTNSESLAAPLVLEADEERAGVDFTLRRLPLTSVAGSMIPPDDIKLLDDVLMVITGVEGTPPIMQTPRILPGGDFVVLLHPGRYRFDIRAVGGPTEASPLSTGQLYYFSTVVDVEDVASLKREFPLREGLRVSGQVRGIGSQPKALRVRFLPVSARRPANRPVDAVSSDDGHFSAEGMAPARYVIDLADADGSWVLDAVRFRGQLQPDLTVDVDNPVSAEELELVVAPSTASLSGTVIGAGEAASSFVLVLLSAGEAAQVQSRVPNVHLTRADNTGGYVFSNRRAGPYWLIVLKDLDPKDLENETFLDSLRKDPGAVAVTLNSNTETKLDLRVRGS